MSHTDPVASAWELHRAQSDWTGRVDAKASFSFGIQAAAVTTASALVGAGVLAQPADWYEFLLFFGAIALLAVGALMGALVVAPQLRSENLKQESRSDHIYFGHLRYLSAEQLRERLAEEDLLPVLSRQVIRMAGIAWTKHVHVQWSIWLGFGGALVLAAYALTVALVR